MTFITPMNLLIYFAMLMFLFALWLLLYALSYYLRMTRAYKKQLAKPEKYEGKKIHKLLRVYHVEREAFPEGESFILAYAKKDESLVYALKIKLPIQKIQKVREYDLIKISGRLEGRNVYIGKNVSQSHAPFVDVEEYKKK